MIVKKTFEEAYPSFANDPFAKAYLNEVDDAINPDDDIDEDLLLDDIIIVNIISRDAVMRSILAYANNVPPASKKVKIPRNVNPRKSSVELWDSI